MQINELREMPSGERARLLAQRASDRKARQDRMTAQRRDMLLDVAQSLLVSGGWERFNLRDMAAKAGYSAGALYAYFDSKDALLHAVRGRWLAELQSTIRAARSPKAKGLSSKLPSDPMAPYQPYSVKMQTWWDTVAKHPLGVSILLWPIWAVESQDRSSGVVADMDALTADVRGVLPCAPDVARMVHSDILMSGLGHLVALGQGASAAQIGSMAERFSEFMRLRLTCWVVDDSETARGAMSLAPEAQPDLFSLNTD
jgi:AcrR family transcriptional regulator